MKPFDLEAAKAGAPIMTRDGRPAKFIAHVAEAHPSQRLLMLIDGTVHTKFESGKYAASPAHVSDNDLFMAPVKRTVWANVYGYGGATWYNTEKDADDGALSARLGGRAWPIEIEEWASREKEIEMTTKKIYGKWIKWHGGECPVPPDTRVLVKLRSGKVLGSILAYRYRWKHIDSNGDIVEYRTVTEQPDLEAAEELPRENGYTVTPPAKPLTFEDVVPMAEVPEKGTRYWMLSAVEPEGILCVKSFNDWFDQRAIKRRVAYPDKEQALVAARRIFGLKGGEL